MNVWFTSNGERLGTLNGHNGTVWTVAVDCECTFEDIHTIDAGEAYHHGGKCTYGGGAGLKAGRRDL